MQENKWVLFKRLIKLQWDHTLKNFMNITSGFILITITLLTWLILKETTDSSSWFYDGFVLASALGLNCIVNCLMAFSRIIFNLKKYSFFKRVFFTTISKKFVIFTLVVYNHLTNLVSTLLIFSISMCFPDQRNNLVNVNWLWFIYGYVTLLVTCNIMGAIIGFRTKKFDWMIIIINAFYFLTLYLCGLGIPFARIVENKVVVALSYLVPHKYSISIMQAGWQNSFELKEQNSGMAIGLGYFGHNWIPFVVSFLLIILFTVEFLIVFIKKYKFDNKRIYEIHNLKYLIHALKHASSFEEVELIHKRYLENCTINVNIQKEKNNEKSKYEKN